MIVPGPIKSEDLPQNSNQMETHDNPRVGSFDTKEVRPHTKHRGETSREISFTTPYSTPPNISVGLCAIAMGGEDPIRITTYATNILHDCFNINIKGWSGAKLYSACCSWLEIGAGDSDFQTGKYSITEDHRWDAPEVLHTRLVTFTRPYSIPPKVVVWIRLLGMPSSHNCRVKVYATHVTSIGFTLHADTWADSLLQECDVVWVAYPTGKAKVFSGTYSTTDMRPSNQPQHYNSGYVEFDSGVFDTPPKVFMAINSLDMECKKDLNVALSTSKVSERGMLWSINSWGNAVLYSAGASYIVLG